MTILTTQQSIVLHKIHTAMFHPRNLATKLYMTV